MGKIINAATGVLISTITNDVITCKNAIKLDRILSGTVLSMTSTSFNEFKFCISGRNYAFAPFLSY